MRWGKHSKVGPIGVDVGSRSIKAVQVSLGGGRPTVRAALEIPRQGTGGAIEESEAARLADVLERQGFLGSQVVLGAPFESLLTGTLSLPPAGSGAPTEQIARMELSRLHKREPASFEMACWELPGGDSAVGQPGRAAAVNTMAAAMPHESAEALIRTFEAAGLMVVGLDVPYLALARACQPLWDERLDAAHPPTDLSAIVDLGWSAVRVIVAKRGVVVYQRVLSEFGLTRVFDAMRQKFPLDDAGIEHVLGAMGLADGETAAGEAAADGADRRRDPQRQGTDRRSRGSVTDPFAEPRRVLAGHVDVLADELRVSLDYAVQLYRAAGVDQIILTGGGAGIAGLGDQLTARTQTTTRLASPAALAHCPAAVGELAAAPTLATALGLSIYVP